MAIAIRGDLKTPVPSGFVFIALLSTDLRDSGNLAGSFRSLLSFLEFRIVSVGVFLPIAHW